MALRSGWDQSSNAVKWTWFINDREIEELMRQLLEDPAIAQSIATRNGTVLGMQTFRRPDFLSSLARPDDAIYLWEGVVASAERRSGVGRALLARSMQWAGEEGFTSCLLHFLSGNLAGARFWQANGFWPLTHTLTRQVDERIAWANR